MEEPLASVDNSDEQYLNEWIKKQNSPNKLEIEHISFSNGTCLEDHRLLIDRAMDKLKGELLQKEKDIIQPLTYRQKIMQEEAVSNRNRLE